MATKAKSSDSGTTQVQFVLLDMDENWRKRLGKSRSVICSGQDDIEKMLGRVTKDSLWISPQSAMTDELLRAMSVAFSHQHVAQHRIGNLFMLERPRPNALPILHGYFCKVFGETPSFKFLPKDQLADVLAASTEDARDVFVGGSIDTESGWLTLVRGNLERITVPLSIFHPSQKSKPNFRHFELDDHGHTVRFGEYEAAADFVLYEGDSDYRLRMNQKRRSEEKGFGPAMRRLRLQRGLGRNAFPGISAKTIARLERQEVQKPHGSTLSIISKTLGVAADAIAKY